MNRFKSGFTLAEMMVVMLIVSIVLVAMAPVMTTKNKIDNSSPWRYSPDNPSDAFFGAGDTMRALIGQINGEETDDGKLIINNLATNRSHIMFKSNNDVLGDLYFSGTSLVLGDRQNHSLGIGRENINIGHNNWPSTAITGSSNITIGDASMTSLTRGNHNIGIGTTLTSTTTGSHNIGIGDDSLTGVTAGDGNIAIGGNANVGNERYKTIAIGYESTASGRGSIAIGSSLISSESHGAAMDAAKAMVINSIAIGNGAISGAENGAGQNSIAIGNLAKANSTSDSGVSGIAIGTYTNAGENSVAIGTYTNAGEASVAIGYDASSTNTSATALGSNSTASGSDATALGPNSKASGSSATALGPISTASGSDAIALGSNSTASGSGAIAIGISARSTSDDSIAIGRSLANWNDAIAIGNNATANWSDTIAIGRDANADDVNNIAIGGSANANTDNAIAIGSWANADGRNNIAIGSRACASVRGSNKICIGANSGPASGDSWTRDDVERVFIGGRSKYNNEAAVLEVHNTDQSASFRNYSGLPNNATSVVVNGNLIVKGRIVTRPETYYNHTLYRWCALTITADNANDYAYYRYCGSDTEDLLSTIKSDRRLKYVGKENTSGLDKIRQLKIFNFTYKKDKAKEPHVGVIAQDLQKVFPNAVKKGADGFLTIRMEDMFYAVINAIKELDIKYQAQEKRIDALEKRIEKLEAGKVK